MKLTELVSLINQDFNSLKTASGGRKNGNLIWSLLWNESFKVTFWFRIGNYLQSKNSIFAKLPLLLIRLIYKHVSHVTGIQMPIGTKVGGGLYFHHYGTIVIAKKAQIGCNARLHQGVTIGRVFAGKKAGVPTIGDNVILFAGSTVIGNIRVGNNVVVGANALVSSDVPDNAVVAGVPAKVLSNNSNLCLGERGMKYFGRL